ncbi:MAG: transketolase C-terminal domain-containing protein, partial [Magnetospiraceae bacterium]
GRPSSGAEDHYTQLEKRARKLETYEFGDHWAEIEGSGDTAIVTWGSITAVVREARDRLKEKTGKDIKVISLRLLMPAQTEKFAAALEGVDTVLVIEQSHSKQFYRYLRAFFDLPRSVRVINKPGPLPFRPGELLTEIEA